VFIKKLSLVVVILLMSILNLQHVYASQQFIDVPSDNDAYEEINYLVNLGVIKGYPVLNGKVYFKPNNVVTRGQAAKMLVIATGNQPLKVSKSSFSDVPVGSDLSNYVERAVKIGYFSAYSNGKFAPNVSLTREEMRKVLSIAFKLNADSYIGYPAPFSDVAKTHNYFKYINTVYYKGIAQGSVGKFNPKAEVTRAQFASFVARVKSEKFRLALPVQGVSVPDPKGAIISAKVVTEVLNVRSSSNTSSDANIVGKVYKGDVLPVYEERTDGWLKIAFNDRYAYVSKKYTQTIDPNAPVLGTVQKVVKATQQSVIIYDSRDVNGKVLGSFSLGDSISVYATEGNWFLTQQNGTLGYVRVAHTDAAVSPVVDKPQPVTTNTIGSVTVDGLNIRAQASSTAETLGSLKRGNLVAVHSITGFWAKISYNGVQGYVHKTYLRLINQSGKAVAGRIIVLDPGHGGKDPGAISNNAVEKSIVFKVAEIVKKKLAADGAIVKMTRTDNNTYPTLPERVKFTTANYAEVFVSFHANASTSTSAKGTETYYSVTTNANEKEDLALATYINNQIVNNAKMYNRGVKRADYVVIKGSEIPSVLVELGFVTNSEDRAKLVDDKYVQIYANSIYNGIVQYYSKN